MTLLAFMLVVAAQPQSLPRELLPSGKWQVEYAKSSCIVSRVFGEGDEKTLFGLKPAPYAENVAMLIATPAPKGGSYWGHADVRLSGGFVPEKSDYQSVTANGMRVTTIGLPRTTFDELAKGESITITAGKWLNVTLKPTAFDKALKALEDCESDLLAYWGFDKTAQAAVATKPKGSIIGLIRPNDYPDRPLRAGIGGTVGFRMKIDADGKVSECTVLESSSNADLDKTTCAVMKKRARFAPAMGHDGKPMWSFTFGRITWMVMSSDSLPPLN
jgi:TonB family protein